MSLLTELLVKHLRNSQTIFILFLNCCGLLTITCSAWLYGFIMLVMLMSTSFKTLVTQQPIRSLECKNEPIRGLESVTRHIEYIMPWAKKLPSLCLCPCHVSTHATCHEASHWSAFRLAAFSLADCYRLQSGYWFDHLTTATVICGENNYQVSVSETWRGGSAQTLYK